MRKDDLDQVAAAYRALFLAAGGGGLGLFTAITRLRQVHKRIAGDLDEAGIPLLAQHVDAIDTSTLVDIFRAEEDACLLGTDAVRDGVDVPGRSLRLIVFDRVPWPRPDILHNARKAHFGAKAYDDMITRLRLKQAFGRLVRRADDHGVFALLDPRCPRASSAHSRMASNLARRPSRSRARDAGVSESGLNLILKVAPGPFPNETVPPSWPASDRMICMPRPLPLSTSKPSGRPIPSSPITSSRTPSSMSVRVMRMVPGRLSGKPCLKALDSTSLTIRHSGMAWFEREPGIADLDPDSNLTFRSIGALKVG